MLTRQYPGVNIGYSRSVAVARGMACMVRNIDQTVISGGMEVRLPASAGSGGGDISSNVLPVGTRLGEFEITGLLGEGGFGIVYLAEDKQLDRTVAIKEYMPSSIAGRADGVRVVMKSQHQGETFAAGLRSFVNEAKLLAQFDHPSLVKVFRFWEAHGTAYMVMPYYRGVTVKRALREMGKPPDEAWLLDLLLPLLDVLELIHGERCYHRDIAPDNVLLLPDGKPLLLDFGAARRVIGDMTQALTVILKPGFAPIEQYAEIPGMRQGAWTDLYALAAVAYYAMTGNVPPPSVARMMSDCMPPLTELVGDRYRHGMLNALQRALSVKPDSRQQTAGEFRRTLLDGAPPRGPRPAIAPAGGSATSPPWEKVEPSEGRAPTAPGDVRTRPLPEDEGTRSYGDEVKTVPQPQGWAEPARSDSAPPASAPAAVATGAAGVHGSAVDSGAAAAARASARRAGTRRLSVLPIVGIVAVLIAVGLAWWTLQPEAPSRPATQEKKEPVQPVPAGDKPKKVPIPSATAGGGSDKAPVVPIPADAGNKVPPIPADAGNKVPPVPADAGNKVPPVASSDNGQQSVPPVAGGGTGKEPVPPVTPPAPPPLTAAAALDAIESARDGAWQIDAVADVPQLRIGRDKLKFRIASKRAGYVYIFMLGTDGEHLYQLFPNSLDRQNRITATRPMDVPGAGWTVQAAGPPGVDRILVMVSAAPREFAGLLPGSPFGQFDIDTLRVRFGREGAPGLAGAALCSGTSRAACDPFGAVQLRIEEVGGVDSGARAGTH
jgi:serine/threonine protein kinase